MASSQNICIYMYNGYYTCEMTRQYSHSIYIYLYTEAHIEIINNTVILIFLLRI